MYKRSAHACSALRLSPNVYLRTTTTTPVMKKYKPVLGVLIATLLTVAVLPVRISEGQGNDPSNLVGSELVIWTMCFTTWCVTYFAQLQSKLQNGRRLLFRFYCVLSSQTYFIGLSILSLKITRQRQCGITHLLLPHFVFQSEGYWWVWLSFQ